MEKGNFANDKGSFFCAFQDKTKQQYFGWILLHRDWEEDAQVKHPTEACCHWFFQT